MASDKIRFRIKKEEENRLKLATSAGDDPGAQTAVDPKVVKAYGQWEAYVDKMGRGVFYYNKV